MKKSYYTKFSIGLIDSLLIKTQEHTDYLIPLNLGEGDTKGAITIPQGTLVRPEKTSNTWEWMLGTSITERYQTWKKTSLDETVHTWLIKSELKPAVGDIDYDHEYVSPFPESITKSLLLLKWICGIQAITKNVVSITKEDLAKIGYDHLSPLQLKIQFDKIFGSHKGIKNSNKELMGCLTYNRYDEDNKTWNIKIGPREMAIADGPGSVRIKITQFNGLLDAIMQHHQELLAEKVK